MRYIVLVKYRVFQDSMVAQISGSWLKKSEIIEVENLLDLNNMFSKIIDVKILETKKQRR